MTSNTTRLRTDSIFLKFYFPGWFYCFLLIRKEENFCYCRFLCLLREREETRLYTVLREKETCPHFFSLPSSGWLALCFCLLIFSAKMSVVPSAAAGACFLSMCKAFPQIPPVQRQRKAVLLSTPILELSCATPDVL